MDEPEGLQHPALAHHMQEQFQMLQVSELEGTVIATSHQVLVTIGGAEDHCSAHTAVGVEDTEGIQYQVVMIPYKGRGGA